MGDGCEGLVEIDSFDLGEALRDNAGLILLNFAIGSAFLAVDPLAADYLLAIQPRHNLEDFHGLERLPLFLACSFPHGHVQPCHGLVRLWLRACVRLSYAGMFSVAWSTFVRRDVIAWVIAMNGCVGVTLWVHGGYGGCW